MSLQGLGESLSQAKPLFIIVIVMPPHTYVYVINSHIVVWEMEISLQQE